MSSAQDSDSNPLNLEPEAGVGESQLGAENPDPQADFANEDQEESNLAFARTFLAQTLRLKQARIDREHFLKAELRKRGCSDARIAKAISSTPLEAGIAIETLDEIAQAAVDLETKRSSAISFGTGLPGGLALFATVPGAIMQQYVFNFRIMQKVAYIYGWQSFLDDAKDIDDETLNIMLIFLSVMLGISQANVALRKFLLGVVGPAIRKQVAQKALMKTVWYPVLKKTLRYVGVQITRDSVAKAVAKGVPVVGGAVSGTMTYVTMKKQSARIIDALRELPPPGMDADEYVCLKAEAERLQEVPEKGNRPLTGSVKKASNAIQGGSAAALEKARGLASKWGKNSDSSSKE